MRVFYIVTAYALLFRFFPEFDWHKAIVAGAFDFVPYPSDHRPDRAIDSIADDLAHVAHTAYHGGHGIILYRITGSLCRGNFGTADPRFDFSALLKLSDRFRRRFLDKSSIW